VSLRRKKNAMHVRKKRWVLDTCIWFVLSLAMIYASNIALTPLTPPPLQNLLFVLDLVGVGVMVATVAAKVLIETSIHRRKEG
jgi:hypothetical protein